MNKEEIKQYIEWVQGKGSVYGLDTIRELLKRLGNPQDQLSIVHIAGTNGKGSILAMLDSIFKQAGYRSGRYISPTIFTYLERFQINGSYMKEETLVTLMSEVAFHAKEMEQEGFAHPTLFEIETAVTFLWFLQEQVDVVLLETGLGGRMDSTNVISKPLCTLFASISRDHMALLGDTIEEIAMEKAGIIKKGCPVIAYPNKKEVQQILEKKAQEEQSPYVFIKKEDSKSEHHSIHGQVFSYKQYDQIELSLLGEHQIYNASVVLEAVEVLAKTYPKLTETAVRKGLKNVKWKGRFEIVKQSPIWIRDGAHNEDAALKLKGALEEYFQISSGFTKRKIFYIIGVLADKEYEKIVSIMAPLADVIVTICTKNNQRALPSKELARVARKYADTVIDAKNMSNAVELVKELARKEDVVVIFGSLSFLGEVEIA